MVEIVAGDVILLGKTNMLRFNHPQEAAKLRKKRYVSWFSLLSSVFQRKYKIDLHHFLVYRSMNRWKIWRTLDQNQRENHLTCSTMPGEY